MVCRGTFSALKWAVAHVTSGQISSTSHITLPACQQRFHFRSFQLSRRYSEDESTQGQRNPLQYDTINAEEAASCCASGFKYNSGDVINHRIWTSFCNCFLHGQLFPLMCYWDLEGGLQAFSIRLRTFQKEQNRQKRGDRNKGCFPY